LEHVRVATHLLVFFTACAAFSPAARAQAPSASQGPPDAPAVQEAPVAHEPSLREAQRLFYNGRYEQAAAMALVLQTADRENLEAAELRTSAILFQLRRAIGEPKDKDAALKQCPPCPDLMSTFMNETAAAQAIARARVKAAPADPTALFLLGKIDLNYVWLQLGTLGRKTGWNEYWEARRSLDAVLAAAPQHVRARVARAWIDYIVDTRMPMGTKWVLGGGNRKRALRVIGEAAKADEDFYTNAEAEFALWDIHIRERDLKSAVAVARGLASDFPENRELIRFLAANDPSSTP